MLSLLAMGRTCETSQSNEAAPLSPGKPRFSPLSPIEELPGRDKVVTRGESGCGTTETWPTCRRGQTRRSSAYVGGIANHSRVVMPWEQRRLMRRLGLAPFLGE